ncbi:MAG: hypothetical protein WBW94_10635 [Anaerolineales bacterium]
MATGRSPSFKRKLKKYEHWYYWLRETDPKTWTEEVREDFMSVFDLDGKRKALIERKKQDYMEMLNREGGWKDRKREPHEVYRHWLDPEMDSELWYINVRHKLFHSRKTDFVCCPLDDLTKLVEVDNYVILQLNLFHSKAKLLQNVERWIDMLAPKKRGRPMAEKRGYKYDFAMTVDTVALDVLREVNELHKNGLDGWKLMDKVQEKFPELLEEHKLIRKEDGVVKDPDAAIKRAELRKRAKEYLDRIKRIKTGVAKGIFPVS